jgi:hypothetical protein
MARHLSRVIALACTFGMLWNASGTRADTPAAAPAPSPDTPPTATPALPASCALDAKLVHAGVAYAPCGEAGVLRASVRDDGSLAAHTLLRMPGKVQALFVRGDAVWVELLRAEARPLDELARESAPVSELAIATALPASVAKATPHGQVKAQAGLERTISLGAQDGLKVGDSVEFYTASGEEEQETPLAVGEVVRVSRHDARVELGMGERVPTAASARPTSRKTTRSLVAPPRIGGLFVLEGGVSPYLPIGTLGVGALASLAVTYLAERPFYARAEIAPVGGVISSESDGAVFAGHVLAGYDHTYFAVGVGVGLMLGSGQVLYDYDNKSAEPVFSVKQSTRLGAADGLHFRVDTVFALASREWHFAYAEGSAQIPLGARTWLTLSGGGGEVGRFAQGALGLRRLVRGDGGSGSLFVKPSVGVVAVERLSSTTMDTGPAVGVHLEWRR